MVVPLPKPSRRDRPRRVIDTSALALPKREPLRDDGYREWVRKRGVCLLPNFDRPCGVKPDRAPIEAAHLEHGGRGIKGSDASCIPLCPIHHDCLDAETLPWQVIAFLWMRALFLREAWWKSRMVTVETS